MTDASLTGKTIKSYILQEQIGHGGFGEVYRAHQQVIDRDVAIKIILPRHANHPDFIRKFEAEAQLVASLEHPFIVPLYDYWREPSGAYLVMRWLRGGNLRESLAQKPWQLSDIVRLVDQICGALNAAHRQNIIHRDIKPDNILLDNDGNAYLTDFGIAKDVTQKQDHDEVGVIIGSVEYLSPEQALMKTLTPLSDVYSFGIVLYQILTGHIPFFGDDPNQILRQHINSPIPPLHALRPDLPTSLNRVIWRATAKDLRTRYQSMLELAEDFRAAVAQADPQTHSKPTSDIVSMTTGIVDTPVQSDTLIVESQPTTINPYKGLRSFQENDAQDFFGREDFISDLLAHMRQSLADRTARFLAIVGPSGSGKSSVVQAGLIPRLRKNALPGSQFWYLLKMTPTADPIGALQSTLARIALDEHHIHRERLESNPQSLHTIVADLLPDESSQFVLIIDQFEELFTLVSNEEKRAHFLRLLYEATTHTSGQLWVVLTLRADYYDRPLQYAEFGSLMRKHTEVILPLTPSDLELAILRPAERVGLNVETGLSSAITSEITNQPGALPLLQYAMTELFDQRDGNMLTLKSFRDIGGVSGAIIKSTEEIFTALDAKAATPYPLDCVTFGHHQ